MFRPVISVIAGLISFAVAAGANLIMILQVKDLDSGIDTSPVIHAMDPSLKLIVLIAAIISILMGAWYLIHKPKGFKFVAVLGIAESLLALFMMFRPAWVFFA